MAMMMNLPAIPQDAYGRSQHMAVASRIVIGCEFLLRGKLSAKERAKVEAQLATARAHIGALKEAA